MIPDPIPAPDPARRQPVDREIKADDARLQRERNEDVVTRAIRTWFQKTEPK